MSEVSNCATRILRFSWLMKKHKPIVLYGTAKPFSKDIGRRLWAQLVSFKNYHWDCSIQVQCHVIKAIGFTKPIFPSMGGIDIEWTMNNYRWFYYCFIASYANIKQAGLFKILTRRRWTSFPRISSSVQTAKRCEPNRERLPMPCTELIPVTW